MSAENKLAIKYSYLSVPTCQRFAEDDSFIRGLLGPFGSGKSSACVVELVSRGLSQGKGRDGVSRSRFAVIRNCFDDQTEILTECRGWQLFKDLDPDERVASLHGDQIVFEKPTMHYAAPYSGEMIGIQSQHIDMLVTPDHRLWTSRRETRKKIWSEFGFEKACDAYGKTLRRFRTTANWTATEQPRYSEAFFRFLGFWFAEGSAGAYQYSDRKEPHWRLVVVQKNDLDEVRCILRDAGLLWGECVGAQNGCTYFQIHITDELKPLIRELAAQGPATRKFLPSWIKSAPAGHLSAFLDAFLFGDGTLGGGTVVTACTSSLALANDLQEVAIKCGLSATVASTVIKPRKGSFAATTSHQYLVSIRHEKRESPTARGWYKTDYDGMVYCLEVSTHVVLVRRNGKAHWSSQTYAELRDTTIKTIMQWLPEMYFGRYIKHERTYTITAFPGANIELVFLALDRPDDIKKLLSLELTGAWVNEAREIPWSIIEALQGRVGRYPAVRDGGCTWFGIWMDTNPPDNDSRWYKFFEETKPANARIFKQPSGRAVNAENLPNLPGGQRYYTNLAIGKKAEWVKVYVDGQYGFVVDGKPVFPEYNDRVHCQDIDPVPGVTIIRSWDFGLTPACAFSQMLPNGQWLVFDEMTSDGMSIDKFSDDVIQHCNRAFRGDGVRFEDWADPAGNQRAQTDLKTCFDIMIAKGIMVEGSIQNPQMRHESIGKPLRTLIDGEPQFILHSRCKNLRKGFMGGYHYRRLQVSGERYSDKVEKNHLSHIMEALEYGTVQYFAPALIGQYPDNDDYPDFDPSDYIGGDDGRSPFSGY